MSNRKTIIAASILAILASGTVIAKGNDFHEDKWSQTKSYGQVLISDDSVDAWGPWGDFVEPAAGGTPVNPISMLGAGASDSYRTLPSVSQIQALTEGICSAGDWCGYAIFANSTKNNSRERSFDSDNWKKRDAWVASLFAMTLTPDSESITAGKGTGSGTASWRPASLGTTDPLLSSSAGDLQADFGGGTYNPEQGFWTKKLVKINGHWTLVNDKWVVTVPAGSIYDNRDNGLHHIAASAGTETQNSYSSSSLSAYSHNALGIEAYDAVGKGPFEAAITGQWVKVKGHDLVWVKADDQVAIGEFQRQVTSYTSGGVESFMNSSSTETTRGYYVAGVATPQAFLSDQQTRNIKANYIGGSFDGVNQGAVAIQVQFGPGTWQGQWNGAMNFQASGNINGATLASSNVSALYNEKNMAYSGSVQGTFYGAQAGSIGGVSNVAKTNTVTQQVVQTQAAIFVVNKVPTPSVQPK